MKEIQLSRGMVALVDDENYETLRHHKWYAGIGRNTYYAYKSSKNHPSMHRVILGITDKKILVDHKDGNGLNNQKSNLRICNQSQNSANRKKRKGSSHTKYIGIYMRNDTGKWAAQIMKNYRNISLGSYNTEKEAAIAYNNGAKRLYGEFAVINQL